ncbi:MAG: hypothetical protein QOF78_2730 [Phycisphaerales bacterium]|jgi:hypothetical protein|nr:hypothetical protein [Phycisphaerales bacterium]
MARKIRLTYIPTGESVIADMLEDEAPAVCDYVWSILPIEHKMLHGQYSGAEVFALLDRAKELPPENICQLPLPGELLWFYDGSSSVANSRKPISEIVFVYNRGVVLRGPEGVPTYCSLFARVPGDWKYDWTAFREVCRKSRLVTPPLLRIERFEERAVV